MNGDVGNISGIDMGGAIAKLLEDPEALGKVMSIAGTLSSSGILSGLSLGNSTPYENSGEPSLSEVGSDIEIPSDENGEKTYSGGDTDRSEKSGDGQNNMGHVNTFREERDFGKRRNQIKTCDRIRLLEAMRPFLSDEKRGKLDVVIKIMGLADAAGGLYSSIK